MHTITKKYPAANNTIPLPHGPCCSCRLSGRLSGGWLCSPNLACLKAHPTLASLALEAAGGWSLGSLQLGHLLHADRLRHLSLASTFSGTISSTAAGVPAVVGKGATPCQAMRPPTMTQHCSTCRSAGVCGSGNAAGSAETAAGGLRLLLPHHRPGSAGSCATAVPGPSSKCGGSICERVHPPHAH